MPESAKHVVLPVCRPVGLDLLVSIAMFAWKVFKPYVSWSPAASVAMAADARESTSLVRAEMDLQAQPEVADSSSIEPHAPLSASFIALPQQVQLPLTYQ